MIIHLIRHGDTQGTENKLYYGSTDLPLSENGRKKLAALREQGGYPCLDGLKVYTSGMLRTEETLSALYGDVAHDTIRGLREMEFGDFEMRSYEQLRHDPAYTAWITGDVAKNVVPGGESAEIFSARVWQEFEKLMANGQDCLLVLHGGVIGAVMGKLFPGENKNFYDWQPMPGKGYTVELKEGCADYKMLPTPCWEGKGYAFFQNRACEYFPCHETACPEKFNCLFCYCPLYALGENCGGCFKYTEDGIKDCSCCMIPHRPENFGRVMEKFTKICEIAKKKPAEQ